MKKPRRTSKYQARTVADVTTTCKLYRQVRENLQTILHGEMMVVDPSCGSLSSMPGWAWYIGGVLEQSGIYRLNPEKDLHVRLHHLMQQLQDNSVVGDLLIYEDIPPRAFGRGATGHASLLKSVGVVLGAQNWSVSIGMKPTQWKKLVSPNYVKGDEADAIEMGRIAIDLARHIEATNPPRGYTRHG